MADEDKPRPASRRRLQELLLLRYLQGNCEHRCGKGWERRNWTIDKKGKRIAEKRIPPMAHGIVEAGVDKRTQSDLHNRLPENASLASRAAEVAASRASQGPEILKLRQLL